nr:hypothetical protein CFP56_54908 [Quercus suber]
MYGSIAIIVFALELQGPGSYFLSACGLAYLYPFPLRQAHVALRFQCISVANFARSGLAPTLATQQSTHGGTLNGSHLGMPVLRTTPRLAIATLGDYRFPKHFVRFVKRYAGRVARECVRYPFVTTTDHLRASRTSVFSWLSLVFPFGIALASALVTGTTTSF